MAATAELIERIGGAPVPSVPRELTLAIAANEPTLNPELRDFWLTPARNRVLYGGRSSSKSWDAAGFAVYLATQCRVRFLCTRQFQNKITESVYTLLKIQIERFGLLDDFEILNNTIRHKRTGSEFLFYGLWRHIDEIKSLESIDICWIEEAHNLTAEQWAILEPTVRKEGSQFWIVFNPRFATDFVYKRFVRNPPPDTIVRKINFPQNPFLSKTILKVIQAAKEEDPEEFDHIYMGVPKDSDDNAVIKRSWVQAAIDAHLRVVPKSGTWTGGKVLGYDVADDGNDANALTVLDGSVCVDLDEWKGNTDELFESSQRVKLRADLLGVNWVGYDSIGVGAGTGANLNKLGWRRHFKFNAGATVADPDSFYRDTRQKNKDYFANLKAQAWWLLADRFRNTFNAVTKGRKYPADQMISISSDLPPKMIEQLLDELSTPLRDFDTAGRVKVESKKDLAKRDVSSPNVADSFIIASSRGSLARRSLKEVL